MLGLELAISIEKSLNLAMREAILVYIILQVKGLPVISFFFLLFLVSYSRILWLNYFHPFQRGRPTHHVIASSKIVAALFYHG
jgi:hypothetical protein